MSLPDPVADMLTRVRNAIRAGHEATETSSSKLKQEMARILKREGYITDYVVEGDKEKKKIRLYLKYVGEHEPAIRGIKMVSKPGVRRYSSAAKLPRTLGGMGIAIISTSSGVLTDREAREKNVGGEVLCEVW